MNTQNNGVVGLTLSIHIERSKLLCLCLDDVGFKCVGGLIMLVLVNREWVKLLNPKSPQRSSSRRCGEERRVEYTQNSCK